MPATRLLPTYPRETWIHEIRESYLSLFAEAWFTTSKPEKPQKGPLTEEEEPTDPTDTPRIDVNKLDLRSNTVRY